MSVLCFSYAATGNQAAKNMTRTGPNGDTIPFGGSGILDDVHIDLTGATAATVQINDAVGIIFGPKAVLADTPFKIDATDIVRNSITGGPLTVTTTSVSGGDTTLTIRAFVDRRRQS